MKKKNFILFLSIFMIVGLCGCDEISSDKISSALINPKGSIDEYKINGDCRFIPISYTSIDERNTLSITEYVNTVNKTVWVESEKWPNGHGLSFTQEYDENGKPVIYSGDLEELKEKYNVK